ncbi:lipid-A-disaccharide synthase [Aestuariirhabdus litorea]|uniref:Lipid-A-disaccharide synthase n=1 Tax=Aestuariirhabdus litorea TaxID=2528527 RepID=A0A3P3VSY9_9GAMM|nr:lipid-A-disaccharide synthase [Aestuariirhabdus litorea]RRJ85098.1 lipid-A-disaccharide synthase [Aestuariirhabdus litorea]RWW98324.1 lipid-A-disaccharide synthase [Endozoicomonadaceae bacterium GTF-13]
MVASSPSISHSSDRPLRVGIAAGEASGDILGAGLIRAIRTRYPNARFEGIAGPLMLAEGASSMVPMERLSVMGLVEVLGRIRELLGIRKRLVQAMLDNPPDLFIGIDAPDFTLPVELKLKQAGIPTAHYVSPSVWAWRQKRIHKIARSVDHMLCLLPFEAQFYREHDVPVTFVGHPLADSIAMETDPQQARQQLGVEVAEGESLLALLPGSRQGEVALLAPLFFQAAQRCAAAGRFRFVIPCVNEARFQQIEALRQHWAPDLDITLVQGHSREVMAAADSILIASGTATLEATLLKKPMVVAYRVSPITYRIASWLVKIPYLSLPNLLAGRELVPELIQDAATPEALADALLVSLQRADELLPEYRRIHELLSRDASNLAAEAVLGLVKG